MLGPLLFLLFVNDQPQWITTNIRMFADDAKVWSRISTECDSQLLQKDLDSLVNWSTIWQLRFNTGMCKMMHVGHKVGTKYFIMDGNNKVELEAVEEEKDLGVYFSKDLKPSKQCITSAAKARKIIGLVRRHFRRMDKSDFLLIYKTYIRPHLEYCVQSWPPHLVKDVECLERVQSTATELVSAFTETRQRGKASQFGKQRCRR